MDLKLCLRTTAHAGSPVNRSAEATRSAFAAQFYWEDQEEDVHSFVAVCLLHIMAKGKNKIPRPLSLTAHVAIPNEVIHFDYLFMGESDDHLKYIFVIKDDLSGYAWLDAYPATSAENAATTLARWNRVFTTPLIWICDQDPHFLNKALQFVSTRQHIHYIPTIA